MEYIAYIYEGNLEGRSKEMILESVAKYCDLRGMDFDAEKAEIKTGNHGKPYIEGSRVHFNLSHSGDMAVVCVGEAPCGIDLQTVKMSTYKAIAKKYYTKKEQDFVDKYALEGFFRIWVHREAYGKLTGEGFFYEMPEFMDDEGYPKFKVEKTGNYEEAFLIDIPIADDIFCCFASFGEEDSVSFSI